MPCYWITENANPIKPIGGTLDLSERPNLFSDEESLSKISLLISRKYLKVLILDLLSLSVAITDRLFKIVENSNCT